MLQPRPLNHGMLVATRTATAPRITEGRGPRAGSGRASAARMCPLVAHGCSCSRLDHEERIGQACHGPVTEPSRAPRRPPPIRGRPQRCAASRKRRGSGVTLRCPHPADRRWSRCFAGRRRRPARRAKPAQRPAQLDMLRPARQPAVGGRYYYYSHSIKEDLFLRVAAELRLSRRGRVPGSGSAAGWSRDAKRSAGHRRFS